MLRRICFFQKDTNGKMFQVELRREHQIGLVIYNWMKNPRYISNKLKNITYPNGNNSRIKHQSEYLLKTNSIFNQGLLKMLMDIYEYNYQIYLLSSLSNNIKTSNKMYADFFKNNKPRYNNPTYQSNLVQSSMLFPYSKYDIVKYQLMTKRASLPDVARNNGTQEPVSASSQSSQSSSSVQSKVAMANQSKRNQSGIGQSKVYQTIDSYRNMSTSTILEDKYRHRRSKSNLSSYGSSSLTHLPNLSDRQVFQNQQKQFNIVNLCPQQYESSIKMFPKFRNQIKQDQPNKMRNAFIHGKPEVGLAIAKKNDDSKGYREPKWDQDGVGKVSKSSLYRGVQKVKDNPEVVGK